MIQGIRRAAVLLLPATAAAVAVIPAAIGVGAARARQRGGLEVQRGRDERIGARGAKAYYTKRWNLSDLPTYRPEQTIAGPIRIWGSGYFAQGSLGKYWEEGFRQHHPAAAFEYHLQAPALAIPALCVGMSDLSP